MSVRRCLLLPCLLSASGLRAVAGFTVPVEQLETLDALLREGSVTRAALRLRIGQPAASHALGRLRELFADPLLVRSGRTMVPTPSSVRISSSRACLTRSAKFPA